jgi:hypothetical protein
MSWSIFQNVSDPEVLRTAIKTMKFNNETFDINNPGAIDTYANLLYKAGKRDQAIKWEKKAVKMSNEDKEFVNTLRKMERGEKTWPQGK